MRQNVRAHFQKLTFINELQLTFKKTDFKNDCSTQRALLIKKRVFEIG
jgi:hypothetical protein